MFHLKVLWLFARALFNVNKCTYNNYIIIIIIIIIRRQCGPVVRALGLHAVDLGSNPVLTSSLDLFLAVLDSTLPRFVNSQLVASWQSGF